MNRGNKMHKRGGKHGFTLVELMVAVLLSGIVLLTALSLILAERKIGRRMEEKENAIMVGNVIFEYVKDELMYAERVFIGDNGELRPPEDEDWKAIYVSGRLENLSAGQAELVMEVCALLPCRLRLTVRLEDGEEVLYERTEEIELLNLSLRENGQLEGETTKAKSTKPAGESKETPLVLWYQSEGGEEE